MNGITDRIKAKAVRWLKLQPDWKDRTFQAKLGISGGAFAGHRGKKPPWAVAINEVWQIEPPLRNGNGDGKGVALYA